MAITRSYSCLKGMVVIKRYGLAVKLSRLTVEFGNSCVHYLMSVMKLNE